MKNDINKKELIEELSLLIARSMWEMLPAFRFKEGKNYTEVTMVQAYHQGLLDMNTIWGRETKHLNLKEPIWDPQIPTSYFDPKSDYTEEDLTTAYYKGLKEIEDVWHKAIKDFKTKIEKEVKNEKSSKNK